MRPTTYDAYRLMHDGLLALARAEHNGIRIDVGLLDRTIAEVSDQIDEKTRRLRRGEIWSLWRRRYQDRTNFDSREQLGKILYGELGYESENQTPTGKPKVDETELEKIDSDFVVDWLQVQKLKKLRSTYLRGIRREVVDGFLRPSFNLNLAISYRSSCDQPNFQNIPIRDKEMGRLIRQCFAPRSSDHVLMEIDYGALEFRIAASFWRDAEMIKYASDPSLDIHRDMAAECYCLPTAEVPKAVRFYAKNQFVFPTLYGSYYVSTAKNLWNAIQAAGLTTAEGVPLDKHLKKLGITKPKFEDHVRGVEDKFARRFAQWAKRREQWWDRYERSGRFKLMTGFEIEGYFTRNQLMNIPIQGPAFHCLLWSFIATTAKIRGWKSKLIGQIHDSIVADVHKDEFDDFVDLVVDIMTRRIRSHWSWIKTPLIAEVEVAEDNWANKQELELAA